eukprot:Skav221407  [mRNA]  locus=scaffold1621:149957:154210:+ [translate_table: standard]
MQAIACLGADLWTASFPCQPWSSASNAKGFLDHNGLALVKLMANARHLRPRVIGLENVQNLRKHDQFPMVCRLIHWCGYRIVFEKILNASEKLPSQRPRWIAILQRLEEPEPITEWKSWGGVQPSNPLQWDAWLPTEQSELRQFQPTKEDMDMYMDKRLTPRFAPYYAEYNMQRYRIPPLQQKTPTFMAQYGSQHRLPLPLLEQKGLQGFLNTEDWKPRFWKPAEIAILHMQKDPLAMLKPVQLAWKSLGNAIVFHHAFVGLINSMSLIHDPPTGFDVAQALDHATNNKLTATNVQQVTDDYGWCIAATKEQAEQLNRQIHHMSQTMGWNGHTNPTWPADSYYDPSLGCCNIHTNQPGNEHFAQPTACSPTLPFPCELCHEPADTELDPPTKDDKGDQPASTLIQSKDIETILVKHFAASTQPVLARDLMSIPPTPESDCDAPGAAAHTTVPVAMDLTQDWKEMMPFLIPGTYGKIQVHDQLTFGDFLQLWEFKVFPAVCIGTGITMEQLLVKPVTSTMLIPMWMAQDDLGFDDAVMEHVLDQAEDYARPIVIMVDSAHVTYCVKTAKGTWDDLSARFHEFPQLVWSDWGEIQAQQSIRGSMRLHSKPCPVEPFVNVSAFLEKHEQVALMSLIPTDTDTYVIHMEGDTESLAVISTLWRVALDDTWQDLNGRQVTFQVTDPEHIRFVIRPSGKRTATPCDMLQHAIAARLAQALLQSISDKTAESFLTIKDHWGTIATIGLTQQAQLPDIFACLQHAYFAQAFGVPPRLVCLGKRIHQETPLDYILGLSPQPQARVIMPTKGGGGARQEHRRAVHSILASMLVEHGATLDQVPAAIEKLQNQFGIPKLTHVLFASSEEEKIKQFCDMCKHSNISISAVGTPVDEVRHKYQKIYNKKQTPYHAIDPQQYTLVPGFFKNQAGQDMPITPQFSTCVSAVTMLTTQEAEPWITSSTALHPDEKAIFLIGNLPKISFQSTKVVAPATNSSGQQCVIAGYLIQLGERAVTHAQDSEHITTHEVYVCSFTLWDSDWSAEQWKQIQDAPVKMTKQLLAADGTQLTWSNPFGRTYHKGQTPCAPSAATSIQFHAEIKIQELRPLLKHSGFNGIYVVPKNEQGRPSPNWRVVWVDLPPKRIETMIVGQAGIAGLIRGRKNHGVRCEPKYFDAIWKIFNGDSEPPAPTPEGVMYKVQNLPYGVDKQVLTEWLEACSWQAHPLKSVGSKAWIIKAQQPPPQPILCFNAEPVIIRQIAEKLPNTIGLVAGPRSKTTSAEAPDKKGPNIFRTGDPFMDPWKPAATSSTPSTAPVPTGPTMAHLTKHDQQIAALETALQQVQETQTSSTSKLDARLEKVESSVQSQFDLTAQALRDLRQDFQESFKTSVHQQDKKMQAALQSTMDEIKDLFHKSEKRKSPPKPPKEEDDDSM